ncbi:aldo/keto reductase [Streptomyces sp. bgisy027]|uniref:aldo/keto reductase n=1 Tax=unclassified Streptomyces TaxID=2593676 RepID=UPI003D73C917
MPLDTYYTLGRSGLRVSRLALGTMTFAQDGWGCDRDTAGKILDVYLDAGGNFVDTADIYSSGASEEVTGALIAERGIRDKIVLSTKFTLGVQPGDPNSAGNGRKSMLRALEGSLRRLGTDYVDLYIVHAWDTLTPVEEVMRGLDDLVSSGKVRYVAFSDVPAWYAARAQTLAEWRGYERLCALQLEYSLAERGIEYEFPDLCQELGLGLMTWAPLGNGLLSGKYSDSSETQDPSDGRITVTAAHVPADLDKRNQQRNWQIVAELTDVAKRVGRTPAQVAVNWVANRPAVGSVILGATKPHQLQDTVASLDFTLPAELAARLDEVSTPPRAVPYGFLPWLQGRINAGLADKRPGYFASRSGR